MNKSLLEGIIALGCQFGALYGAGKAGEGYAKGDRKIINGARLAYVRAFGPDKPFPLELRYQHEPQEADAILTAQPNKPPTTFYHPLLRLRRHYSSRNYLGNNEVSPFCEKAVSTIDDYLNQLNNSAKQKTKSSALNPGRLLSHHYGHKNDAIRFLFSLLRNVLIEFSKMDLNKVELLDEANHYVDFLLQLKFVKDKDNVLKTLSRVEVKDEGHKDPFEMLELLSHELAMIQKKIEVQFLRRSLSEQTKVLSSQVKQLIANKFTFLMHIMSNTVIEERHTSIPRLAAITGYAGKSDLFCLQLAMAKFLSLEEIENNEPWFVELMDKASQYGLISGVHNSFNEEAKAIYLQFCLTLKSVKELRESLRHGNTLLENGGVMVSERFGERILLLLKMLKERIEETETLQQQLLVFAEAHYSKVWVNQKKADLAWMQNMQTLKAIIHASEYNQVIGDCCGGITRIQEQLNSKVYRHQQVEGLLVHQNAFDTILQRVLEKEPAYQSQAEALGFLEKTMQFIEEGRDNSIGSDDKPEAYYDTKSSMFYSDGGLIAEIDRWVNYYAAAPDKEQQDFLHFWRGLCFPKNAGSIQQLFSSNANLEALLLYQKPQRELKSIKEQKQFLQKVERELNAPQNVYLKSWAENTAAELRGAKKEVQSVAWEISEKETAIAEKRRLVEKQHQNYLISTDSHPVRILSAWHGNFGHKNSVYLALVEGIIVCHRAVNASTRCVNDGEEINPDVFLASITRRLLQEQTAKQEKNQEDKEFDHYLQNILEKASTLSLRPKTKEFYFTLARGLLALGACPLLWMDNQLLASQKLAVSPEKARGYFLTAEMIELVLSHLQYRASSLGTCELFFDRELKALFESFSNFAGRLHQCVEWDDALSWQLYLQIRPFLTKSPIPKDARFERAALLWATIRYLYLILNHDLLTCQAQGEPIKTNRVLEEAWLYFMTIQQNYDEMTKNSAKCYNRGTATVGDLVKKMDAVRSQFGRLLQMQSALHQAGKEAEQSKKETEQSKKEAEEAKTRDIVYLKDFLLMSLTHVEKRLYKKEQILNESLVKSKITKVMGKAQQLFKKWSEEDIQTVMFEIACKEERFSTIRWALGIIPMPLSEEVKIEPGLLPKFSFLAAPLVIINDNSSINTINFITNS